MTNIGIIEPDDGYVIGNFFAALFDDGIESGGGSVAVADIRRRVRRKFYIGALKRAFYILIDMPRFARSIIFVQGAQIAEIPIGNGV